jgi:uncharacterized RDD family membrane protein YckC
MIVGFFGMVLGVLVGIAAFLIEWVTPNRPLHLEVLIIGCGIAFSIVYYVAAWAKSGQTIGKATLGIKIVGADG